MEEGSSADERNGGDTYEVSYDNEDGSDNEAESNAETKEEKRS